MYYYKNMEHNLDKKLKKLQIQPLSDLERDQMWQRMHAHISEPKPYNIYSLTLIHAHMIKIILSVIILFVGSVATVAASNSAKPGDFLFPIDRAVENVQIKFSSDKNKDKLKVKFAHERAEEIEEVLLDSSNDDDISTNLGQVTATSTTPTTTDDISGSQSTQQERIEQAFATALEYIAEVKLELVEKGNTEAVAAIDLIINQLEENIEDLPEEIKLEVKREKDKYKVELEIKNQDSKQEIKFESEGNKSEYESKGLDGKVKIKVEDDGSVKMDREDYSTNIWKDNEDNESYDDNGDYGLSEVEAKIYTNKTTIKVKFDNQKHYLTTTSTDRNTIVDVIVNQFDVTREEVEQILEIEQENHSSDSNYDPSTNSGQAYDDNDNSADDSDASDSSDENSDDSSDTQPSDLREAEAEIKGTNAKIKIKIGEQEYEYSINASTRKEVVNNISNRYNLDSMLVDQILKLEIKSEYDSSE